MSPVERQHRHSSSVATWAIYAAGFVAASIAMFIAFSLAVGQNPFL